MNNAQALTQEDRGRQELRTYRQRAKDTGYGHNSIRIIVTPLRFHFVLHGRKGISFDVSVKAEDLPHARHKLCEQHGPTAAMLAELLQVETEFAGQSDFLGTTWRW